MPVFFSPRWRHCRILVSGFTFLERACLGSFGRSRAASGFGACRIHTYISCINAYVHTCYIHRVDRQLQFDCRSLDSRLSLYSRLSIENRFPVLDSRCSRFEGREKETVAGDGYRLPPLVMGVMGVLVVLLLLPFLLQWYNRKMALCSPIYPSIASIYFFSGWYY